MSIKAHSSPSTLFVSASFSATGLGKPNLTSRRILTTCPTSSRNARTALRNGRHTISMAGRGPGARSTPYMSPRQPSPLPTPAESPSSPSSHVSSMKLSVLGRTVRIPGRILLMVVPFTWASYSICLKWLYRLPWALNPAVFNFARLFTGLMFYLPRLTRDYQESRAKSRNDTGDIYRAGIELGMYAILSNYLQSVALRYTSAARSTFISQLATIIVPIAAFVVGMEPSLGLNVIAASVIAVGGVAMLTLDDIAQPFAWRGDGVMLVVAAVAASYVLRSKVHASKVRTGPLIGAKCVGQTAFAAVLLAVVALRNNALSFSAVAAAFQGATPLLLAVNAFIVLWAGLSICVMSSELQIRGQKLVSASEAVVIFTSTPLWASLLAIPLGERFGLRGIAGAALILLSTLLASRVKRQEQAVSGTAAQSRPKQA